MQYINSIFYSSLAILGMFLASPVHESFANENNAYTHSALSKSIEWAQQENAIIKVKFIDNLEIQVDELGQAMPKNGFEEAKDLKALQDKFPKATFKPILDKEAINRISSKLQKYKTKTGKKAPDLGSMMTVTAPIEERAALMAWLHSTPSIESVKVEVAPVRTSTNNAVIKNSSNKVKKSYKNKTLTEKDRGLGACVFPNFCEGNYEARACAALGGFYQGAGSQCVQESVQRSLFLGAADTIVDDANVYAPCCLGTGAAFANNLSGDQPDYYWTAEDMDGVDGPDDINGDGEPDNFPNQTFNFSFTVPLTETDFINRVYECRISGGVYAYIWDPDVDENRDAVLDNTDNITALNPNTAITGSNLSETEKRWNRVPPKYKCGNFDDPELASVFNQIPYVDIDSGGGVFVKTEVRPADDNFGEFTYGGTGACVLAMEEATNNIRKSQNDICLQASLSTCNSIQFAVDNNDQDIDGNGADDPGYLATGALLFSDAPDGLYVVTSATFTDAGQPCNGDQAQGILAADYTSNAGTQFLCQEIYSTTDTPPENLCNENENCRIDGDEDGAFLGGFPDPDSWPYYIPGVFTGACIFENTPADSWPEEEDCHEEEVEDTTVTVTCCPQWIQCDELDGEYAFGMIRRGPEVAQFEFQGVEVYDGGVAIGACGRGVYSCLASELLDPPDFDGDGTPDADPVPASEIYNTEWLVPLTPQSEFICAGGVPSNYCAVTGRIYDTTGALCTEVEFRELIACGQIATGSTQRDQIADRQKSLIDLSSTNTAVCVLPYSDNNLNTTNLSSPETSLPEEWSWDCCGEVTDQNATCGGTAPCDFLEYSAWGLPCVSLALDTCEPLIDFGGGGIWYSDRSHSPFRLGSDPLGQTSSTPKIRDFDCYIQVVSYEPGCRQSWDERCVLYAQNLCGNAQWSNFVYDSDATTNLASNIPLRFQAPRINYDGVAGTEDTFIPSASTPDYFAMGLQKHFTSLPFYDVNQLVKRNINPNDITDATGDNLYSGGEVSDAFETLFDLDSIPLNYVSPANSIYLSEHIAGPATLAVDQIAAGAPPGTGTTDILSRISDITFDGPGSNDANYTSTTRPLYNIETLGQNAGLSDVYTFDYLVSKGRSRSYPWSGEGGDFLDPFPKDGIPEGAWAISKALVGNAERKRKPNNDFLREVPLTRTLLRSPRTPVTQFANVSDNGGGYADSPIFGNNVKIAVIDDTAFVQKTDSDPRSAIHEEFTIPHKRSDGTLISRVIVEGPASWTNVNLDYDDNTGTTVCLNDATDDSGDCVESLNGIDYRYYSPGTGHRYVELDFSLTSLGTGETINPSRATAVLGLLGAPWIETRPEDDLGRDPQSLSAGTWAGTTSGVRGIVPEAQLYFFPRIGNEDLDNSGAIEEDERGQGPRTEKAWLHAIDTLDAGDVLIPSYIPQGLTPGTDARNILDDPFAAPFIEIAIGIGITVVIPAGDSGISVDDLVPDRGVITVGGVTPGVGSYNGFVCDNNPGHLRYVDSAPVGDDRNFIASNYATAGSGALVTSFWGQMLTTCGGEVTFGKQAEDGVFGKIPCNISGDNYCIDYLGNDFGFKTIDYKAAGQLSNKEAWNDGAPTNPNTIPAINARSYTNNFVGTTGSAAVVGGMIAAAQSYSIRNYGIPMTPSTITDLIQRGNVTRAQDVFGGEGTRWDIDVESETGPFVGNLLLPGALISSVINSELVPFSQDNNLSLVNIMTPCDFILGNANSISDADGSVVEIKSKFRNPGTVALPTSCDLPSGISNPYSFRRGWQTDIIGEFNVVDPQDNFLRDISVDVTGSTVGDYVLVEGFIWNYSLNRWQSLFPRSAPVLGPINGGTETSIAFGTYPFGTGFQCVDDDGNVLIRFSTLGAGNPSPNQIGGNGISRYTYLMNWDEIDVNINNTDFGPGTP